MFCPQGTGLWLYSCSPYRLMWPWVSHFTSHALLHLWTPFSSYSDAKAVATRVFFCYVFDTCLTNALSCLGPLWELLWYREKTSAIVPTGSRREEPGQVSHMNAQHPSFQNKKRKTRQILLTKMRFRWSSWRSRPAIPVSKSNHDHLQSQLEPFMNHLLLA